MGMSYTDVYFFTKDLTEWSEKQKRKRALKKHQQKLPKAGWYPDCYGILRWWDGNQWTNYTAN